MNTTPRIAVVSLAVGVALALAPSAAGASSEEPDAGVVDAVTISAPIEDTPSFGDGPVDAPSGESTDNGTVDVPTIDAPIEAQSGGPVDAPVVVDDAETISAPIDDAETISAPIDDDGVPTGAIGGGVVFAGAAIAGAVVLRRGRARRALA